ncbi:Ldh family oxidoreductase [Actinosynnema sp. NPDC023587]|uniref:Ldh family oxidoreductase n=1 Tax=Actinosynnema sp. NPDC023587 TaxID=3154695 RepID=UPI0033C236A5
MLVATTDIRDLMVRACRRAAVPDEHVDLVVDHYLEGELRGKTSHGVAKFCFEAQYFAHRRGTPFVTREHGAVAVVDGNREVGPVSAAYAVDLAVDRARRFGVGLVGVVNTQRYGILATWAERIARNDLVGVVMNTSTADSTVLGARTPFLGVNPLGYAFPTAGEPLVVDMSTTLASMGHLWEARRGSEVLRDDCFVDADGEFTGDPHAAAAAVVFGGHKGFALSLLIQVLTGSLFGFPMSTEVDSTWTTGYAFLAMDPSAGGPPEEFRAANSRLVEVMAAVSTRDGGRLRLFGESSAGHRARVVASGRVDLAEPVYRRLRERAAGVTP